jgi:hypothetical protein
METLQTLGVENLGDALSLLALIAVSLVFVLPVMGLSIKAALYGAAAVILAIGAVIGITLYGGAALVAVTAITIVGMFVWLLARLPFGSHVEHYHIGGDGEIHHYRDSRRR